MSILNTPNDGLPNIYDLIFNCIDKYGPISEEKLSSKCVPSVICDPQMFDNILKRWTQLGVFKKDEEGLWSIVESESDCPKRVALNAIFHSSESGDVWSTKDCYDFIRAAVWLLAQDITKVSFDEKSLQYLESQQFSMSKDGSPVYLLQNGVRIRGFKYWASYFDFFIRSGGEQIDPTGLIRIYLENIFIDSKRLSIDLFYERLIEVLPIFPGGSLYEKVTDKLNDGSWPKPKTSQNELPTSLSRAILRLEVEGVISIDDVKGDGFKLKLMYSKELPAATVSHITLESK